MSQRIYVGKIAYDTTEKDLEEIFEPYGPVTDTVVITDPETGKSKGFGFLTLDNDGEAAIEQLDGTELHGRTIKVDKEKPREARAT